jgi:uncharacterized protein (DUF1919 family)
MSLCKCAMTCHGRYSEQIRIDDIHFKFKVLMVTIPTKQDKKNHVIQSWKKQGPDLHIFLHSYRLRMIPILYCDVYM